MFSGIVEALGTVEAIRMEPPGCRLIIREPKIAADTNVADSICVNGCCLTVVERKGDTFGFQAGPETLARTNLGELQPGSRVNLERALAVGGRLRALCQRNLNFNLSRIKTRLLFGQCFLYNELIIAN